MQRNVCKWNDQMRILLCVLSFLALIIPTTCISSGAITVISIIRILVVIVSVVLRSCGIESWDVKVARHKLRKEIGKERSEILVCLSIFRRSGTPITFEVRTQEDITKQIKNTCICFGENAIQPNVYRPSENTSQMTNE